MKTAMQFEWECIYCYGKFTAIEDIDGECPHCKEDYEWDFDGDYGGDSVWGIQWISTYPDPQKYRLLKNKQPMKTAVEQLMIDSFGEDFRMTVNDYQLNAFQKALEKEKEQIINAYCDGAKGGANGTKGQHENGWVSIQMRNKYYNQTYNQNK